MKEDEIRKRDVLNRYLELVKIDAEVIFRDKSTFQTLPCPACESARFESQFEKSGFFYLNAPNVIRFLSIQGRPTQT